MTDPSAHDDIHALERFVDGDLDDETRDQMRAALRSDAALRARLSAVQRLDERCVAALLRPPTPAAPRALHTRSRRLRGRAAVAWTALAACAAASFVLWRHSQSDPPPELAASGSAWRSPAAAAPSNKPPEDGVRVVCSVVVRRKPVAPSRESSAASATAHPPKTRAASTARQSPRPLHPAADSTRAVRQRSSVDDVALAIAGATDSERDALLRTVAAELNSTSDARPLLDRLSTALQAELAAELARRPALRPLAFERLRQLAESSGSDPRVARALDTIRRTAELRAYVIGYRLPEAPAASRAASG